MDLTEPPTYTGPSRRASWWRRLPLTAQLAVIGMLVALAWFLSARLAADRAAELAAERVELRNRLHAAELAATRLLTDVSSMAAAQRGFVITADEEHGIHYEQARRGFVAGVSQIQSLLPDDRRAHDALARMSGYLDLWDLEVVSPNFAERRQQGRRPVVSPTITARVLRGAGILDSVRVIHAELMREIRSETIRLDAAAETAAALDEWEGFLIRLAALAIFLLLLTLLLRLVARALHQVVRAAEALDAGRYEDARLPYAHRAPNAEMARLAFTFDRLSQSIATRERQLQEDIEQLKELERLKADFVSTVSHELRTPLTSMRGALGLLLGGAAGDISPKARELLRIALTNTDRLIRLINDILDIEKMDAGHVSIRRDRLRLRPLLETTLAGLDGLSKESGVRLELGEVAEADVIGDADRLVQVFTNLVSNAVKFSPKDQPVEVSAHVEGDSLRVLVRDHGPGIPEEFASRIFGRFQQAGGAASRQSGGTGLGLSIAKGITELHGGRIGFEGTDGGGTAFYVTLPVAPAPTTPEDRRPGVLIVEDDESLRDVLSAQLEPFARTIVAGDAGAALRVLAQDRIRIVILDHGLPGLDGLAFARRLRADPRYRTLAVLLYSASEFNSADLRESGIRVADAFVKTRDSERSLIDRVKRELQGD